MSGTLQPPLVALHPQAGNRTIDIAPPGVRSLKSLLGTAQLAALRAELAAGSEAPPRFTNPINTATPAPDAEVIDVAAAEPSLRGSASVGASLSGGALHEATRARAAALVLKSKGFSGERPPTLRKLRAAKGALKAFRLLFPRVTRGDPARLFAVTTVMGKQFKVTSGDVINAERLRGRRVGDEVVLPAQLVGSVDRTLLGRPNVDGAAVRLVVEEHAQDLKVIVFKKSRRKRYQRTQGHRREVTRLRVVSIDADMAAY
jgi:large subunit ribosomal protein L21